MFTGLVEGTGRVVALLAGPGGGRRLSIERPPELEWPAAPGESVAVSGVCLTVVAARDRILEFDLAEETCRVTTLGALAAGAPVNLERPLRLQDRLGGHLVLGHIDGVGQVVARAPAGAGAALTVRVPTALRPLLVPKGSVAVDGISLTVAGLDADTFDVALVPHTLARTTLGGCRSGDAVNLEMDVIGKYVRAWLEPWAAVRR
jgi:riboflavin synthase alpha subunit